MIDILSNFLESGEQGEEWLAGLPDCHSITQREARQPIGSGSSASERAKIIMAMKSPLMKVARIDLKCI
jgi:hypothetical protein